MGLSGEGKDTMYWDKCSELHDVEFTCKPFNELFWNLWMLFAKFTAYTDRELGYRKSQTLVSIGTQIPMMPGILTWI